MTVWVEMFEARVALELSTALKENHIKHSVVSYAGASFSLPLPAPLPDSPSNDFNVENLFLFPSPPERQWVLDYSASAGGTGRHCAWVVGEKSIRSEEFWFRVSRS